MRLLQAAIISIPLIAGSSHGKAKRNEFAGICTATDRENDVLLPFPHVAHR